MERNQSDWLMSLGIPQPTSATTETPVFLEIKLAYTVGVSVAYSARSRHFLPFGQAKIGASICRARPNFRAVKKRKMLQAYRKALRKRLVRKLKSNQLSSWS